ncbi:aldo/keto reductase [Dechloromonas sp. XY25]|uniref:Aldo/keto reductase n=1 Tax=Dechloromonas hankyongensis TaxID=2908002 RepID=A0ABS9K6T3_9RHOO|nr:aldo/keto reductase [Dechloromonas hankyongensis]MCG2578881.1 aldo/keto reductase [Dechloromonas hankyongensis]
MKLGLGTVQFGLDYGITNTAGQPPLEAVRSILGHAIRHGVHTLDTAALYGDSESVLGQALPRPHPFSIVSKTLPLDTALSEQRAISVISAGIDRSLQRLGEPRLSGLLVHRPDDLLGPMGDALFEALNTLRSQGLVKKIGVSVYTPQEALTLLRRYPIEIVQLPLNPLDQRHLREGSVHELAHAGVEIHVRSAFLQGLLLAPSRPLPSGLEGLAPAMAAWQSLLATEQLTPLQASLAFLRGIPAVSVTVCGATSLTEWQEIVAAYDSAPALPTELFKKLPILDDKLIDPRFWPKR